MFKVLPLFQYDIAGYQTRKCAEKLVNTDRAVTNFLPHKSTRKVKLKRAVFNIEYGRIFGELCTIFPSPCDHLQFSSLLMFSDILNVRN